MATTETLTLPDQPDIGRPAMVIDVSSYYQLKRLPRLRVPVAFGRYATIVETAQ